MARMLVNASPLCKSWRFVWETCEASGLFSQRRLLEWTDLWVQITLLRPRAQPTNSRIPTRRLPWGGARSARMREYLIRSLLVIPNVGALLLDNLHIAKRHYAVEYSYYGENKCMSIEERMQSKLFWSSFEILGIDGINHATCTTNGDKLDLSPLWVRSCFMIIILCHRRSLYLHVY